ncbi:hypothetical protein BpHYR1_016914 [Brachionus plicatilis]|uniref:Uncharacterized protein n=1 Tax=Brachionus plicatilis TaxID=10195 RepID=A0A3M7SFI4_BRAPC|nr:hypothetical protein BpHYR1_016914 [Brachionus plicatilis]
MCRVEELNSRGKNDIKSERKINKLNSILRDSDVILSVTYYDKRMNASRQSFNKTRTGFRTIKHEILVFLLIMTIWDAAQINKPEPN